MLSRAFDIKKWFKFIVDHPYQVITLIALITLLLGWQIPRLRFQTSIYDLAIENLPETVSYEKFKKEFGTEEIIFVVVKGRNILAPETFEKVNQVAQKLSEIQGVRRVISLPGIKKAMDVTEKWTLHDFEGIITPVDLFPKNLLSVDKKTTVISLILEDIRKKDQVIDSVEKVIEQEKTGLSLYQIGMPLVSKALAEYTEKDFFRLPPLTLLVMAVVLFFLFRKVMGILIPIGSVLLALSWTFGLMAWSGTPLAMLTMIVPILIIAVGTAYCMYIMFEYLESLRASDTSKEAATLCFSRVGFPTSLAVITTVVGLGSLLLNKIEGIREFAVFSCLGIISMLVVMLVLLPAVFAVLPLPKGKDTSRVLKNRWLDRLLEAIVKIDLHHQKTTLLVISLMALVGIMGIGRLKVETNPVEYFKKDSPVSRHFHDIYRDMSGSFPINVVLDSKTEDYFEDHAHLEMIPRLQGFLGSLEGVDKTLSFADYLKLVNYATNQYKLEYYALPKEPFEIRTTMNNYKTMLGQDVFDRFMKPDLSSVNILLRTHISSSRDFLKIRERILDYLEKNLPKGIDFQVTGFGIVMSQSSHLLTSGQVKSFSLTLVLIFGIMFLLFLSAKVGLIAILPNCFPIIVTFGLMGWLGIRLSVATSLIASIAIGLAIDDIIHYMVRYNNEFKRDADRHRALHDTLMNMGRPIIFTSLAISLGFSILIFSHFEPTSLFGMMMVLTMLSALVGSLVILPSLMLHVRLATVWDLLKSVTTFDIMSGDIVHEMNQPLNAIKMGSEFLKMMIQQGEKIPQEYLTQVVNEIDDQVDRASEIINRLREFGRKADFIKEKVDINKSIRDVVSLFNHQLRLQNMEMNLDLDDNISPILAQNNGLRQVFFNLLANARDAIDEKGKTGAGPDSRRIHIRSFMGKNRVVITVSDTGTGIPGEVRKWIFEPFFTTKGKGQGKGLGLFITNGIIKGFDGNIHVESKEGIGTTFRLTFPGTTD
ncbi:MAG: MMPL family transporter [Pseudomonadota bacterium]